MYRAYDWTSLAHFPAEASGAGVLIVSQGVDNGWVIQKYYGISGDAWERSRNIGAQSDNPWKRIDNFGCNTLSSLANALGAQYNTPTISDFDDVTASGKYFISGTNISNGPRGQSANCRGFLFVEYFNNGFPYYCQRYIEIVNNTNKMWIRTHDTTWSSWKEL